MTEHRQDSLSTSTRQRTPDSETNPETGPTGLHAVPDPAEPAPSGPTAPEQHDAQEPEIEHNREQPGETAAAPVTKTKVGDRVKAKIAQTARRATNPARRLRVATRDRLNRRTAQARERTSHLLDASRSRMRDTATSARRHPAPWAALVLLVTATAEAARRRARR